MSGKNKLITAILILASLLSIAILGRGILRQQQFDGSSQEFAISAALSILSSDTEVDESNEDSDTAQPGSNPEFLRDYAHPSLLNQETLLSDYINSLYFATRYLGELEVVESISGGSDVSILATDANPSAAYELEARYSGGAATIRIELLRHEDNWLISEFLVGSEQLSD